MAVFERRTQYIADKVGTCTKEQMWEGKSMWMAGLREFWKSILGDGTVNGSQMVKVLNDNVKKCRPYPIK